MAISENLTIENEKEIKDKNKDKNLYYQINQIEKDKTKRDKDKKRKRRNLTFIVSIILLLTLAIINMFSVNFYIIFSKGLNYFRNYVFYIGVALACFGVGCKINYRFYNKKRISAGIILISLGILIFVFIGSKFFPKIVPNTKGAYGWIKVFGFTLQPAEFLKLPFIILLAHLFERIEKEKFTNLKIILYSSPIPLSFGFFILLQKDLGTVLHYVAILVFMLFFTRIDMKIIVTLATTCIATMIGAFYWIYNFMDLTGAHFRFKRITSFINGLIANEYDGAVGYQVWQSLIAFGSGGVIGRGYANGVQKYKYLPEVSTDFILASYGEELGFVGMFILMVLFIVLFNIIKTIAIETRDYFGKYLAMGIGGYIITQVLINIYVALGMLPVFGIPMPIFSYGGSSLVTIFASLGIILNINNNREN